MHEPNTQEHSQVCISNSILTRSAFLSWLLSGYSFKSLINISEILCNILLQCNCCMLYAIKWKLLKVRTPFQPDFMSGNCLKCVLKNCECFTNIDSDVNLTILSIDLSHYTVRKRSSHSSFSGVPLNVPEWHPCYTP